MYKTENKYFSYFLAGIILVFLLLPLSQSSLNVFKNNVLSGDTTSYVFEKPEIKTYLNAEWQNNTSNCVNRAFGFRALYVRIINQIKFTAFNKATSPGIVIGKNGDLLVESYIDEYSGKNYLGIGKINSIVSKIKQVQDSLETKNIDLIVMFAPGKASFAPEIIPDNYLSNKNDSTNFSVYKHLFKKQNVNFIDLNSWFYNNRNRFKHKVFPKYGAHWNHYGMCLGLDTLIKYIEFKRNLDLPDFDYSQIKYSSDLKNNDFDIGVLMNTFFPITKDSNPYPDYKITSPNNKSKPDVLVVGDSYWWCLTGENLPSHFFKNDEYWFYNNQQLINNKKTAFIKDLNFFESIRSRDVIVLISCEATYHLFPFGFIDNAYKLLCENNNNKLTEIINNIHNNNDWYNSIVKKAQLNNISIEKQIKLDAEFILSEELFSPKLSLDSIVKTIKLNKDWLKDIEIKAEKNKITIEKQIELDAQWYFDNQNTK